MSDDKVQKAYMAEAAKFNLNASRLILSRGDDQLPKLFQSLGFTCQRKGKYFSLPCPVCGSAFVWIGTSNPKVYPIYWGCPSKTCPSKESKACVKNLLGLVRACTEDQSLGTAYKVISKFLGYDCPYDITNMDEAGLVPPPQAPPEIPITHQLPRKPFTPWNKDSPRMRLNRSENRGRETK